MAKKYYAVWHGRKNGIFDTWEACKEQVEHYPGAGYKSFKTLEQATKAFTVYSKEPVQYYISEVIDQDPNAGYSPPKVTGKISGKDGPIMESIAVDASCIGNPGILEYRGVMVNTGKVIFTRGPFTHGTNNIGEFLAIVEGIRYCIEHNLSMPIYSDSSVAIKWVRDKHCNTRLRKEDNEILHQHIYTASHFLKGLKRIIPVKKWETASWGEIPADYDRK